MLAEPVIAITFSGIITAEYARQGFFQLLFVSMINFTVLYLCLGCFRKHRILKLLLTVFSICTIIKIISSGYRMVLYVGEYRLTFLRLLVLWFLVVLTFWMAGGMVKIYKKEFCLFRYLFLCSFLLYAGYACLGESKVIARYNLNVHNSLDALEEWGDYQKPDLSYLLYGFPLDAAPLLFQYPYS